MRTSGRGLIEEMGAASLGLALASVDYGQSTPVLSAPKPKAKNPDAAAKSGLSARANFDKQRIRDAEAKRLRRAVKARHDAERAAAGYYFAR